MCYFSNYLMNLSKTVLHSIGTQKNVCINETSRRELVYDFLYGIYDAFNFRQNYKIHENNIDYLISFKQHSVVVAKIIELNENINLDNEVKMFKGFNHMVYVIYTDGIKFITYKRNQDEFVYFHTFDLKNINEIDCDKYYDMRWYTMFFRIEELTEKIR